MLTGILSADPVTGITVLVKALGYGATLVALGMPLAMVSLPTLGDAVRRTSVRLGIVAAFVAILLAGTLILLRASFLMGGTLDGAFDPAILSMVTESPLGIAVLAKVCGLLLVVAGLMMSRATLVLALMGSLVVAVSFALRGHTLGEPRYLMGALITLHICCIGFWLASLAPLAQTAKGAKAYAAGKLAETFGAKAVWVVSALILVGVVLTLLLSGGRVEVLWSDYGQGLILKIALFSGVFGIAVWNKMRLTPAMLSNVPRAAARFRRSIGIESLLIALVLLVTAALTTVTAPP